MSEPETVELLLPLPDPWPTYMVRAVGSVVGPCEHCCTRETDGDLCASCLAVYDNIAEPLRPCIEALADTLKQQAELLLECKRVLIETRVEIEYWHREMLVVEERSHPRGNGWARVYDNIEAIVSKIACK